MSYLKGLDEYDEYELLAELSRRAGRRQLGLCDYCGGTDPDKPCRFTTRHFASIRRVVRESTPFNRGGTAWERGELG